MMKMLITIKTTIRMNKVLWLIPVLRPSGSSMPISSCQTLQVDGSFLNAAQIASKALSGVSLPLKVFELITRLG
jgi:hypothetical protein